MGKGPGALCISIDVERAWGIWDKPNRDYFSHCLDREASIMTRLVALFETFEAPVTWAVVGRLFERDSDRDGDLALWYAPGCVDEIRASGQAHEVCSHSFAHVYYGQLSRELAASDLRSAARVHRERGLPFESFVFPRNDVAHLDVLVEQGVRVFRSVDRGLHMTIRRRLGAMAGRAANLADKLLPLPPTPIMPIRHSSGLVELETSMLLMSRQGVRRAVHPRAIELKAGLGLDAAVASGGVFHLWFHPSNFYYDDDRQFEILTRILGRARRLRETGRLSIRTMASFAS